LNPCIDEAIMGPGTGTNAMRFLGLTAGIRRADLTRDCLREVHMWPGCETVWGVAVVAESGGRFRVHVTDYGLAKKKVADRAMRYIQREKLRRYHLNVG